MWKEGKPSQEVFFGTESRLLKHLYKNIHDNKKRNTRAENESNPRRQRVLTTSEEQEAEQEDVKKLAGKEKKRSDESLCWSVTVGSLWWLEGIWKQHTPGLHRRFRTVWPDNPGNNLTF